MEQILTCLLETAKWCRHRVVEHLRLLSHALHHWSTSSTPCSLNCALPRSLPPTGSAHQNPRHQPPDPTATVSVPSPDETLCPPTTIPPPLLLPPFSIPITGLGRTYRPNRLVLSLPVHSLILPEKKRTTQVVDLPVQRHIDKTVRRKANKNLRRKFNKTINKPWLCELCKTPWLNKTSKKAHLKLHMHWLRTEYKGDYCKISNHASHSSQDFRRHLSGRRCRRNLSQKK